MNDDKSGVTPSNIGIATSLLPCILGSKEWALSQLDKQKDIPYIPYDDGLLEIYEFGACPECISTPVWMNINKHHFQMCETHKCAWYVGRNIFDDWADESEEKHRENKLKLRECTEVEPVSSHLGIWDKLTDDEKEQVRRDEMWMVVQEISEVRRQIWFNGESREQLVNHIDRILNHMDKLWPDRRYGNHAHRPEQTPREELRNQIEEDWPDSGLSDYVGHIPADFLAVLAVGQDEYRKWIQNQSSSNLQAKLKDDRPF